VPNLQPTGYPVAILINRWSASASEIVAAALQDHLRAVIVGERSYGKGSVQNILPVESGVSALKLTTASYWRPSEKNIHRFANSKPTDEWGVKPNEGFEIKLTDEERLEYYKDRRERDIVRKRGAAPKPAPVGEKSEKNDKSDKSDKKQADKKTGPFKDRVLEKALEYIRGELKKDNRQGAQAPAVPQPRPEAQAEESADTVYFRTMPNPEMSRRLPLAA
jgi:carboxyl-terminal processing protease